VSSKVGLLRNNTRPISNRGTESARLDDHFTWKTRLAGTSDLGSSACSERPSPSQRPSLQAKHSIGCLYYLLARMVLQMRGTISPANPWDVMVDLFFYREPEELENKAGPLLDNPMHLPVPGSSACLIIVCTRTHLLSSVII